MLPVLLLMLPDDVGTRLPGGFNFEKRRLDHRRPRVQRINQIIAQHAKVNNRCCINLFIPSRNTSAPNDANGIYRSVVAESIRPLVVRESMQPSGTAALRKGLRMQFNRKRTVY